MQNQSSFGENPTYEFSHVDCQLLCLMNIVDLYLVLYYACDNFIFELTLSLW